MADIEEPHADLAHLSELSLRHTGYEFMAPTYMNTGYSYSTDASTCTVFAESVFEWQ